MAKNPFDQFDNATAVNPFDQFDAAKSANAFDQFDDLIPATPPQGEVSAPPAVAVNSGLVGGEATGTVQRGFQLPPVMDPFGINKPVTAPAPQATFKAGTPGFSVMGDLKPVRPMPAGVRPEFVQGVTQELLSMTPEQRAAVMQEDSLRGTVAKRLMMQVAEIRAKNAQENTPERARRREFAEANPLTGALASGAANTLKATINIPTVAADLFNQTVVNPIGQAVGLGSLPRVGMMPGTESLESMAGDYMPAVGKQSLAQAIDKGQFQDWFMTNMSAQAPQIGQTLSMAMVPALRPLMLPTVGAQEAASEYTEGDDSRVAAVKGTIATLAEMLPLKAFDKVRDRILALPVGAQRGLLAEAATRATAGGAALTVQSLVGGIEEGLTEFGKNVTDVAIGRDTPLGKNVPEAMVLGTGAGGVMSTPNVARALLQGDTESPAAQLARALQGGVDSTSINQDATRRAAVDSLNPARAQMERIEPTLNFDDLIPPSTNQPGEANGNQVQGQEAAQAPAVLSNEPTPIDPANLGAVDPAPAPAFAPASPVTAATPGEPAPSVAPAQPEPPAALTPPVGNDAPQPSAIPTDTQRVSTVTGRQVETRMRVVDASELQAATGDLQPRDRSRASSDEQINTIASQLDPQRLGFSSEADRGAPIIGPDMIVESGNGRVMAIRRAFEMFPERAQAYRDYLASQGYDTTGVAMPVLVRERVTPMTPDERRAFVQEANQAATMALTPVEQANMDTAAMTDSVVDAWRGGDVGDAQNRDFVSAFVGALPQAQRNALLDGNNRLSPDGATRIRRALLAAAYDDRDLLTELIESADDNIRSIGNALFDSAAPWLQMRRMARDGVIDQAYDTTAQLVQAARTVSQLRRQRQNIKDWLAQDDLASERDPVVDAFVRGFYNEGLTRAVGRDAINDVLQAYVRIAKEQDTGSMFGDTPTPTQLAQGAVEQRNERNKAPEQQGLLDAAAGDVRPGQGVQQRGRQAQDSTVQRGGARSDRQGQPSEVQRDTDTGRPAQDAGTQGRRAQAPAGEVNERASRSERDDAGTGQASRQRGGQNDGREENQRVKGAQDQFRAASYTTRQSIYRDAFEGLGLDPAEMELKPPVEQYRILAKGLKERFGLSLLEKSEQANIRESIDQLLDAYRNMQFMAHVLDLPNTAIGLNGTMGIALISKGKGFLGAYFPAGGSGKILENLQTSGPTIAMPGRSNSFAHEWGHALDYFIAEKYQGAIDNLSGMVREGESLSDQMPESLRDSFRLLMNALFFDNAEMSGRIMDLERRIEAAAFKGIDATGLKAELAQLQSGASKARKGRSQFYQASGEYGQASGSDPSYWRKPTEMLARSFEAYVAHKVEAGGGTTEFIAKGDDAYQSDADSRLRMTFPKDSDRFNIFRAYDLLFQSMRDEMLFGDGPLAQAPTGTKTDNRAIYFSPDKPQHPNWFVNWLMNNKEELQVVRMQEKAQAARPKDPRTLGKKVDDAAGFFAYSNRGVLLSMEAYYRKNGNPAAAKAVNEFRRRIATDPGSGRESFKGGVYAEAVERETKRYNNALGNIVKEHKVGLMDAKELAQLTQALTAPNVESLGLPAKVLAPAVAMRKLSNDMYYFLKRANVDVGFIKDQGYLPRLMDTPLVENDPQGFARAAAQVYQVVYERDTVRPSDSDDIAIALAAIKQRAKEAGIDTANDPSMAAFADAQKQINKLLRALDAATKSGDDDQIDIAQAKLQEFLDANMDILDEAYDYVGTIWSEKAANDYLSRILFGSVDEDEVGRHSPAGSFTKERVLPPEADRLLAPYYIKNPAERMQKYIGMAVRRAEYERRFGKASDNAKTTQYQDMKKAMELANVRADDQAQVLLIVKQVAGHLRSNSSKGALRTLSGLHALGSMAILGRVTITSLPETLLAATQTGRPIGDTMRMLANAATQIVQTGTAKERSRMARTIGLVSDFMADELIQNRLGGEMGESRGLMARSSQFFQNVLLSPLTKAQRTIVMPQMMRYALDMANDVADTNESASVRLTARSELLDMGLMDSEIDTFSQWAAQFRDRMPDVDELMDSDGSLTDMGQALATATNRLVGQTIQNPTAIDRQFMANTPYGRLVYALTSYLVTMFRNVPIKLAKQIKRQYDTQGLTPAAGTALAYAAAPLVVFYAGTFAVTVMREAIFNPEQWEKEEEKEGGFPWEWLSLMALSRTGIIGMADPFLNAYLGIKYQRDLTALTAGPSITFVLSNFERISKLFLMNSEKNDNTERAAVRALYELAAQPALAYSIGSMAGPYGWAGGIAYMFASSPAAKKAWTDAWFEEPAQKKARTGEQKKSNTGGW
jgi:hypothetical protein